MIKTVLFDMDDTILRLDVPWKKVEREIRGYAQNHGLSYGGSIPRTLVNEKDTAIRNELIKIIGGYEKQGWQDSVLFPGTKSVLAYLKERYFLGLVTGNGSDVVNKVLKKFGLQEYFDAVVTREGGLKPLPDPILKAVKELGVSVNEVVFVGNGLSDMEAARTAGVRAVGLAGCHSSEELKKAGADLIISDLIELKELLA